MSIKNIGSATLETLVNMGCINSIASLYKLDKHQLSKMPGSGQRKTEIILEALTDNKAKLEVFLSSLGIHNLGRTTSKILAKKYKTLDAILDLTRSDLK